MWVLSLCWEDLLEQEMATHSSVLCLENSIEEPGGLQSLGSKESDTTEPAHPLLYRFVPWSHMSHVLTAEYGKALATYEIKTYLPFKQSFPSCCPKVIFRLLVVGKKCNF